MYRKHRPNQIVFVMISMVIVCSGWLAIVQPTTGQPTQEPRTDPTLAVTVVPTRVLPTATTPPREVPTRVPPTPTDAPRVTPTPTPPPLRVTPTPPERSTQIPTPTITGVEPTRDALEQPNQETPTEIPPPIASYGTLRVRTRICPPEVDTGLYANGAALAEQCAGIPYYALHKLSPTYIIGVSSKVRHEHDGSWATYDTVAGWWWWVTQLQTPPEGVAGFQHLSVVCDAPGFGASWLPIVGGNVRAYVPIKVNQTTSCTRYVYPPVATGSLTLHAWQCPAGYDWAATVANPIVDCDQATDNVAFMPDPNVIGKSIRHTAHSGVSGPGMATISPMIPGVYSVHATSEPFGNNTDWHILGACGSDSIILVDWDASPGSGWVPNAVIVSGNTTVCNVFFVPPP